MLKIGVQTKNVVEDDNPLEGFKLLKRLGFSCVDLNIPNLLTTKTAYVKI
jgi:hypothetical protein